MNLPKKSKEIVVNKNTYTVQFPNNRSLMAIYSRKAQLSKETYDALSFSTDGNTRYVAMLIDAFATFETIMPEEFFKDLNVKTILDLDVLQGAELVKIYRDQYEGWFDEWTAAIADVLNPKEKHKKDDN